MASFNRVILMGNLTREPEIRYIQSGVAVTKFRIAVNPNKRDAKPEDTTYVDIVAWERLAETCNTYLKKGSPCLVEGRLSIRSYDDTKLTDNTGAAIKRTAVEVVINSMQMIGTKREDDGGGGYSSNASTLRESENRFDKTMDELDEEIPF